jgi:hypothetical protein
MDPVQAARPDAPPDRVAVQAGIEELRERHHAVLARGQRGDDRVRIGGCAE